MEKEIHVAIVGNPNSGKTTLFNELTGTHQHVGNYPGVTVEKKEGTCRYDGTRLNIVDLPGTYSLTAYSTEEIITRNYLTGERPDVVIDVIDSSNLERNLYLAVQLKELDVPLVLAFNMSDMAKARGLEFDLEQLSRLIGAPIVPTIGHRGKGIEELLGTVSSVASGENGHRSLEVDYGPDIEKEIEAIRRILQEDARHEPRYPARWHAMRLLENCPENGDELDSPRVIEAAEGSRALLETVLGDQLDVVIAERRYEFISRLLQSSVRSTMEIRQTTSDRIDSIVTNRVLGLPIFLGLMYLVFHLTFTLGDTPMIWIESLFSAMAKTAAAWWPTGSESPLLSLLVDGVIGGVGGVLVFLPNILLLFLAIALLEDSGYMARAAFIMDRLMRKISLHGKSFIPMLIGFGCSVPAIMATRTLENRRDRMITMLVIPLMSCGARLPIYALIIPAFFPAKWNAPMLWIIYMTGILLAVVSAKLLHLTLFKGEPSPLIMELPPYRLPTLRSLFIHMWERSWLYLRKAGTVILGISILLWAMTSYPKRPSTGSETGWQPITVSGALSPSTQKQAEYDHQAHDLSYSVAGRMGHLMEPVLRPMGFDWKIGTALIGAFAAKEVFVSQLGIVYSVGEVDDTSESLREKLRKSYTPLVAFCIMLFTLVSTPCMATIAVTRRESNSWRWALFQLIGLTVLAYVLTVAVYQIGILFDIGM